MFWRSHICLQRNRAKEAVAILAQPQQPLDLGTVKTNQVGTMVIKHSYQQTIWHSIRFLYSVWAGVHDVDVISLYWLEWYVQSIWYTQSTQPHEKMRCTIHRVQKQGWSVAAEPNQSKTILAYTPPHTHTLQNTDRKASRDLISNCTTHPYTTFSATAVWIHCRYSTKQNRSKSQSDAHLPRNPIGKCKALCLLGNYNSTASCSSDLSSAAIFPDFADCLGQFHNPWSPPTAPQSAAECN